MRPITSRPKDIARLAVTTGVRWCHRLAAGRRQIVGATRTQVRGWPHPAVRPLAVVLLVALMLGSLTAIGAAEQATSRFVSLHP
jgi:hypothetical protein